MLITLLVIMLVAIIVLVGIRFLPLDGTGKQIAYGVAVIMLLIILVLLLVGRLGPVTLG